MINETDLLYAFPAELVKSASGLITLFKAVGVMVILYLIFGIVNILLNKEKKNELKEMNKNLMDIKKLLAKKNSL
ncbi:MAG: hypothetical protein ABIJ14_02605 [Nanoarchaeota archaeon]